MMMAFSSSLATAGRYNSLKFTSDNGETYTIATNSLEILVNNGNLTFSNTDLTLPLTSLVSMEFTDYDDSPTSVDAVILDGEGPVTVYSINGVFVGSFESYTEALGSLSQGVFVIKDVNGNSLKVSKGK